MDSLLFLSARRLIAHRPLPTVPAHLYPVLFQAAFLDGRPLVLQDLVAQWPFPVLNFQRMVGHHKLCRDHPSKLCFQSIILAVVEQLRRDLEEPGCDSSPCRLRVLDVTGLQDDAACCAPDRLTISFGTMALAKACVEVSKHQQEFQKRRSRSHKGSSGAAAAPRSVDVHADLLVNGTSYRVLWDALKAGNASPLRLKCRELQAEFLRLTAVVRLLESLDPSGVRRVDLRFSNLGLGGVSSVLPHLSRFPDLRSLRLPYSDVDVQWLIPESVLGIQCLASELGELQSLRELNLGYSRLSGNLRHILCKLEAPLESLELAFCSLLPSDFAFLSQSFHAPALKRLDLSGHDFSQSLLQPLQHLLEETSASLLHLDLMECRLTDSHLDTLLASLQRCSLLRSLGLFGNFFSMSGLKDFLRKTVVLPDLRLVVYPIPVDSDSLGLDPNLFVQEQLNRECLGPLSVELGQMLKSSGRPDVVCTCNPDGDGALDYFSL